MTRCLWYSNRHSLTSSFLHRNLLCRDTNVVLNRMSTVAIGSRDVGFAVVVWEMLRWLLLRNVSPDSRRSHCRTPMISLFLSNFPKCLFFRTLCSMIIPWISFQYHTQLCRVLNCLRNVPTIGMAVCIVASLHFLLESQLAAATNRPRGMKCFIKYCLVKTFNSLFWTNPLKDSKWYS